MWQLISGPSETDGYVTHIVPIGDLKEHDFSSDCWCCPDLHKDEWMVVHHSADNREAFETGQRKPS